MPRLLPIERHKTLKTAFFKTVMRNVLETEDDFLSWFVWDHDWAIANDFIDEFETMGDVWIPSKLIVKTYKTVVYLM